MTEQELLDFIRKHLSVSISTVQERDTNKWHVEVKLLVSSVDGGHYKVASEDSDTIYTG